MTCKAGRPGNVKAMGVVMEMAMAMAMEKTAKMEHARAVQTAVSLNESPSVSPMAEDAYRLGFRI